VLARVLATRPTVVVLNGPTVGVDIGAKEDIHLTIRRLAEEGLAVVMVSDDLGELAQNSSRVLVFQRGLVAAALSGEELTEDRLRDRLTAPS
jgi:simple sugar transport system ATP-binding protein